MTKKEFEENIILYTCQCCGSRFSEGANYLAVCTNVGILLLNQVPLVFCCGDCMYIAMHYRYIERSHNNKLRRPIESDLDKQKIIENGYKIPQNWAGEQIAIINKNKQ